MKQILSTLLLLCSFHSRAQTLEGDRQALVAIYNAMGGAGWHSERDEPWPLPSQPGDNPCGWFGVTCENGRVTSLNLSGNEITGYIPIEIGNLTALRDLGLGSGGIMGRPSLAGKIPAEFGNLGSLETLNLVDNNFDSDGFDVLWTLTSLKDLIFSPTGPVSDSIGNLANLESLMLYFASTTIPANIGNIPTSIGNLTMLKKLHIYNSGFSGSLPTSIGNLTSLTDFLIANSELSGPIPSEIDKLVNLIKLDVTGLKNGGNMPVQIGNLINLESLNLSFNELTGSLPASFNKITKALTMNLSGNNLSGPIPDIGNIKANRLQIGGNKFTFDGMEANFSRLWLSSPQQKIGITKTDHTLSVFAGGTLANNTYRWYRFGELVATKTGDSTFLVTQDGNYHVTVSNSIVTTTMLTSETYSMTLPVTLVSFEGQTENNQTKLTWKTTSETNNKGFEIERSADARTFEKIGFVDGGGDTKENQFYHFTDLHPIAKGYYRLKQLDYDGRFEYSRVIAVRADKEAVRIYPNPAQAELTVTGAADNEWVSVFTSTGTPVMSQAKLTGSKLDVSNLKEGIYTIKIGDVTRKLLIKR